MFRLQRTIKKLNTELNDIHKQTQELSDLSINNVLNNYKLSKSQKTIIHEIIMTSNVDNSKSM